MQFKIALQSRAFENSLKHIQDMIECQEFEPDYLALAAHEALASNAHDVARAALHKLVDLTQSGCNMKTSQAAVLRNLIQLAEISDSGATVAAELYQLAASRVKELSFEKFFGEDANGLKEAKWFAGSSWNLGVEAGKKQEWQQSSVFLVCAADFFAQMPESPEVVHSKKLALLLGASSLLSSSPDAAVADQALLLLDQCSEV